MMVGANAHTITTANGTSAGLAADRDFNLALDFQWPISFRDVTNNQLLKDKDLMWFGNYDPNMAGRGTPTFYILTGPNGTDDAGKVVEQVRFDVEPAGIYSIINEYYARLPVLVNDATEVPSRIPYSKILTVGAERRARIEQEEPEDSPVIMRLDREYEALLGMLIEHYAVNPNKDEGVQVHGRLTDPDIYA